MMVVVAGGGDAALRAGCGINHVIGVHFESGFLDYSNWVSTVVNNYLL
jgi:hypothetical protein